MRNLPVVYPRELVFLLVVPLAFPFEVVLVVQPTADGAAARQPLRNVFPLHARAPELDNQHIFLRAPFGMLLGRRRERVRRGGRAALVRGPRDGGREPRVGGRGGRQTQGQVFGRGGDGDGPREGGLENLGDLQLGGWNDKSCYRNLRDGECALDRDRRGSTADCDEGDQGAKTSPETTFGVARRRSCVVDK